MTSEDRFVVDTNVAVSGILFQRSIPGQALDRILATSGLLHSDPSLEELHRVLRQDRFDRYVSRAKREEFLLRIVKSSTIIDPTEVIAECRDPDDDKWLELAVGGEAKAVVTGDQDLLVLHPFRGIPIRTPADFLADTAHDPRRAMGAARTARGGASRTAPARRGRRSKDEWPQVKE